MRWSDLDQLNHVNNVVYVDYAAQARAELLGDGAPRVTGIETEFRRPLLLSRTPVVVRSEVDGDATTHAIAPEGVDEPFATVRLSSGDARPPVRDDVEPTDPLALRRTDAGADGTVTASRFFELTQEARIFGLNRILPGRRAGGIVVARVDVRLGEPVSLARGSIEVATAVTHVGRSSYVTTTWFEGGRGGVATAVLVGFDVTTQRSRVLDDDERQALLDQLVVP